MKELIIDKKLFELCTKHKRNKCFFGEDGFYFAEFETKKEDIEIRFDNLTISPSIKIHNLKLDIKISPNYLKLKKITPYDDWAIHKIENLTLKTKYKVSLFDINNISCEDLKITETPNIDRISFTKKIIIYYGNFGLKSFKGPGARVIKDFRCLTEDEFLISEIIE